MPPLVWQGNKRSYKLPSHSLFCINISSIKMHEGLTRCHGHICAALHACHSADDYFTLKLWVFSHLSCYGRAFGQQKYFSALTMTSVVSGGVAVSGIGTSEEKGDTIDMGTNLIHLTKGPKASIGYLYHHSIS